jgi:hypothetical protein
LLIRGFVDLITQMSKFAIRLDLRFVAADNLDDVFCVRLELRTVEESSRLAVTFIKKRAADARAAGGSR